MSTHGPIQEEYRERLKFVARYIDELFNGKGEPKEVGFALLLFDFGSPSRERMNYLSNANREDMICSLKELLARFEGRHIEETQTAVPTEKQ